MSVTGRNVDAAEVTDAVVKTLQTWFRTFLVDKEQQRGWTPWQLPGIRSWTSRPALEHWPEEQLPALIVVCPGTADIPRKDGSGIYAADWTVGVYIVVSAATMEQSDELAKVYAAAARATLVKKGRLGGFANGVVWRGDDYDPLPVDRSRSLMGAAVELTVTVNEVLHAYGAPAEPLEPPALPGDWPLVEEVDIDIETVRSLA